METISEEPDSKRFVKNGGNTRYKLRQNKLKISFILYIICLCCLAVLQFIGLGFFTKGFLLSRQVLPNRADCDSQNCFEPTFDKTILLVIDALRFDFIIPIDGSTEYYHNNLPLLYDIYQKNPENSVLLKFMADPPTTTLQRLKGLTTGSLPTFVDAGSNFDGDTIDEDNWLSQLCSQNKTVAFMGDDTWDALFQPFIAPHLNFPYPSLNVWDLNTVDNGVIEHLFPLMDEQGKNNSHWDFLIGHFLGVDHSGHTYGPKHYSMGEKLKQMNDVLAEVIEKLDDDTLLIVMGDHGMDSNGNHGGDSLNELEAGLFMYSKKPFAHQQEGENHYDISNQGRQYRSVNQIDLVPTISILLGLPIPYNNLGFPIKEAFNDDSLLYKANFETVHQIQRYRNSSSTLADDEEINDQFKELVGNYTFDQYESSFNAASEKYQLRSLEKCKDIWARFDLRLIGIGIALMSISLVLLIVYSRLIPSVVISQMSDEFIASILATVSLGLVIMGSIFFVLRPENMPLSMCLLLGVAVGIIIGFFAPIMDRYSVPWLLHQIFDYDFWTLFSILLMVLHVLIFASNSFTIWEDKFTSFCLVTFGFVSVVFCLKLGNKAERILGVVHSFTFILLTRIASMISICREEQGSQCQPNFEFSWWAIIVLHLLTYILPLSIKAFYNLSNSYHSAAPLWIGTGLKLLLLLNSVYWFLDFIENDSYMSTRFNLSLEVLKSVKLTLARIVMGTALVAANFGWSRGPLCIKLELTEEDDDLGGKRATILGYGNAYGSSYFLMVINFVAAIMLTSQPLGAISIFILLNQILSLLELYQLLGLRTSMISTVIFGLLGYSHFFTTGHQATIPSIQWQVGFMTTETIVFPFTHLNILLNTFGSVIIVCLCVPLITLWSIPPSTKPITLLSKAVANCTTLMMYQAAVTLSTLVFACFFRRHLMVWKIFAPRFMFSGLLIVLMNVVLIVLSIGFGTGRVIQQMNRIFGK